MFMARFGFGGPKTISHAIIKHLHGRKNDLRNSIRAFGMSGRRRDLSFQDRFILMNMF